MTTVSATTQTSINPYSSLMGTGMANDFFGSQAFGTGIGTSIYSVPQQTQTTTQQVQVLNENPNNLASALLGEHYLMTQQQTAIQQTQAAQPTAVQTTTAQVTSAPTLQDYYAGTQIANMFSNSNSALISPYDSYFQRDFFGQQMIANSQSNNQGGISYSA